MPTLTVVESQDSQLVHQVIPLLQPEATIGRVHGNTVKLNDTQASRLHATIHQEPQGWWIEDLGSANGTFINGNKVDKVWLRSGDTIRIGSTAFRFQDEPVTAPVPATRPATPPPPPIPTSMQPPAKTKGRTGMWILISTAAVVLAAAIVGAAWWVSKRSSPTGPEAPVPSQVESEDRPLQTIDYGIPEIPPINAPRIRELARQTIQASSGGQIVADGVSLNFPPGSLDQNREIVVHEVEPPTIDGMTLLNAQTGETVPAELGLAYEVDCGGETDLFPGEIEISIDLKKLREQGKRPLYPVISIDGKTWLSLPHSIEGDRMVYRTRHFSVTAVVVGFSIGIPLVGYFIVGDELPSMFHEYAPFVRLGFAGDAKIDPVGVEIYWSKRMPDADPDTGLVSQSPAAFEAARNAFVDSFVEKHGLKAVAKSAWPDEINRRFDFEEAQLTRRMLMPEKAKTIEDAVDFARNYLEVKRKFTRPFFNLPVYIVPKLPGYDGYLHNPWSGRRYLCLAGNLDAGVINSASLHELFHHYQAGYVTLSRNSHLPMEEAAALMMEREAAPCYQQAGKPFDIKSGMRLAQYIGYRHSLKSGPDVFFWQEKPIRNFGYSLTWLLEYLKTQRVGDNAATPPCSADIESFRVPLDPADPLTFQYDLFEEWKVTKYNAVFKVLVWAAGGTEEALGKHFLNFAKDKVLAGDIETKTAGASNPYWKQYGDPNSNVKIFSDSPYKGSGTMDTGLKPQFFDFGKEAAVEIGDDLLTAWSIQFFKCISPKRPHARLVVMVPLKWFSAEGNSRGVFLREKAEDETVMDINEVDEAPIQSDFAVGTMDFDSDSFVYIVDTGQTGSAYFSSLPPAKVFVLEPPSKIEVKPEGKMTAITWQPPPAAGGPDITARGPVDFDYILYVNGTRSRPLKPLRDMLGYRASISPDDIVSWSGAEMPMVEIATAVEIGKDVEGNPVYVESKKSDPVGSTPGGLYEMVLEIDTRDKGCENMLEYYRFFTFTVTLPCEVKSDGSFTFMNSWKADSGSAPVTHRIQGSGTFLGDHLKIEGRFHTETQYEINRTQVRQVQKGTFSGEGEYKMSIWFGHKVEGTYQASINRTYCTKYDSGECVDWTTDSSECTGVLSKLLCEIISFTKKQ